uniref:Siah interacting protein N-terminal domain-containing protein n=1 Tax=Plectus sambesii TaxID=2011161 RepID=A0A914UVL7_9BILA
MSSELELDLQELQQLRAQATRPGVQASLDANVKELERKLQQAKKREQDQEAKAKQPSAVVTSAGLPKLKITTYAWDQSDKFLKIYVTVPKVETAAPDQLNAVYGTE